MRRAPRRAKTLGSSRRTGRHNHQRWLAYHKFIRSREWERIRHAKMESVDWLCERCPPEKPRIATQVHHVSYIRFGGDEFTTDLEALCDECHRRHHKTMQQQRGLWLSLRVAAEHAQTQFGVGIRDRLIASYDHA